MKKNTIGRIVRFCGAGALALLAGPLCALGLQVPQINGCTAALGSADSATVKIPARADVQHPSGSFVITGKVGCTPPQYAGGQMSIKIDMSDSSIKGDVTLTSFDYVVATGKHTPTISVSGQCKFNTVKGCRYWLSMTDNAKPGVRGDVIGFLILDGNGARMAYGSGVLESGELTVSPAP